MANAAAAMSLGVRMFPLGAAATTTGAGSPLTIIALQSNSRRSSSQATRAMSPSPLCDSKRRAKPAMSALRVAWACAIRACLRMPAARRPVTSATISKTATVTTSVTRSMRKVWIGSVKKKL